MEIQDYRLNSKDFKKLIGKKLVKYKCNPFIFTNSVHSIVGIYIGDKAYKIYNEVEPINYFGSIEDVALFHFKESNDEEIKSEILGTNLIETLINDYIISITLINEHQELLNSGNLEYNVYHTRAIIFGTNTREYCFEKDDFEFSEEIIIKKGHDLKSEFPKPSTLSKCEDFDNPYKMIISQENIVIK